MRALLLLLVLMGMAEVGWGQKFERDTSNCFTDTFIRHVNYHKKVEWLYYIDSIHSSKIDSIDLYQRCEFVSEYAITGDIKYIFSSWYNKQLNKNYPMKLGHFFCFYPIKPNWGIGLSIISPTIQRSQNIFNEMHNDFGIPNPILEFVEFRVIRMGITGRYNYNLNRNWGIESKLGFQWESYSTVSVNKDVVISSNDYRIKSTYGMLADVTMVYYLRLTESFFYRFMFGFHLDYMGYGRSMPQLRRFMPGAFIGIGFKVFAEDDYYFKIN